MSVIIVSLTACILIFFCAVNRLGFLADRMQEADQIGAGGFRLMFTVENARQTGRILQLYEEEAVYPDGEFTRGHWKKGIK